MLVSVKSVIRMFLPWRIQGSRKGSVIVEYVVLVSIVALSVLIMGAMTGFRAKVAAEYTEMGSELATL